MDRLESNEIRIDGLTLRVIDYSAEEAGAGLVVDVLAELDSDEHEAFRDLWVERGYMTVKRIGIDETDRSMRFGQVFWSAHDRLNRYRITLVEEAYDAEQGSPFTLDLQNQVARGHLAYIRGVVAGLTDLLVEKGVISGEDSQALKARAEQEEGTRTFDFYQVVDAGSLM